MLYVYRASAGSGKTHLLTGFYLKLLFRRDLAPATTGRAASFKEILAVTFTNKATAEMKSRIIDELDTLAHTPAESPFYDDVNPHGEESEEAIRRRAAAVMQSLLNDYTDFNVSTIDSFFQRIVRTFARDLDLQGNYDIELDAGKILEIAVNNFLAHLDTDGNRALFEWMLDFSRSRIGEGGSWDFKRDLLALARVLTSEDYRTHADDIQRFTSDKAALASYAAAMQRKVHDFRTALRRIGASGQSALAAAELIAEDFAGKSNNPMHDFAKWANGEEKTPTKTFRAWVSDESRWFVKSSPLRGHLAAATVEALKAAMSEAVRLWDEDYCSYATASVILRNIYQLGILADIDREMREYCAEEGIMLLSGTNELLHRLIDSDNSPFIYEKTGTRIAHFMIDEFQDTSGMQWDNFKPLLSNSLADGNLNLIVGDVKQSIYRWRGSDWGLLHAGLNDYEPAARRDDNATLRTNWRSLPEVVRFNNEFFPVAALALETALNETAREARHDLTAIYADVAQQLPPQRTTGPAGMVQVEFMEGDVVSKQEAYVVRRLPEIIIDIERQGYAARDIAILARTKDHCALAAETLLRYKAANPGSPWCLDVISGEALRLSARSSVQTLIALLRHINNPRSEILRAVAVTGFHRLSGCTAGEAIARYALSPDLHPSLRDLASRPLYEMVEELISLLPPLDAGETPFLDAFRDLVLEFAHSKTPHLPAFLDWWDESGDSSSISMPEGQNAIRVMTIHQAKGLGMPVVIIPFASWGMDIQSRNSDILWCRPDDGDFARDGLVLPINVNKKMADTIFHKEYEAERLRVMIDNLNVAYVAFTRAKEVLYLLVPPASSRNGLSLSKLLADYVGASTGTQTFGSWPRVANPPADISDADARRRIPAADAMTPSSPVGAASTTSTGRGLRLPRLSLRKSRRQDTDERIRRGNLIHAALSAVTTAADAATRIDRLYDSGATDETLVSREEMKTLVADLLASPEARDWFAPRLRVLNEHPILSPDGSNQRPDRVVIRPDGTAIVVDYKTGAPHPAYRTQVKSYVRALADMGFTTVEGYLWYIESGRIERIDS